jgi:hypothetical protein
VDVYVPLLKLKLSMKKLLFVIVSIVMVGISSCQNENSVNPRPEDQIVSKVTITGRVKAELNNTTTGTEKAPAGLKIIAEIDSRDLVLNPTSGNYPSKYYEATLDANGEYSLEVEAGPYGSDVYVYFPDFRADVVTAGTPVSTLFNGSDRNVYVIKGKNEILDFTY